MLCKGESKQQLYIHRMVLELPDKRIGVAEVSSDKMIRSDQINYYNSREDFERSFSQHRETSYSIPVPEDFSQHRETSYSIPAPEDFSFETRLEYGNNQESNESSTRNTQTSDQANWSVDMNFFVQNDLNLNSNGPDFANGTAFSYSFGDASGLSCI